MTNEELIMTNSEAIDIIKCLAWHTRPNEEDIEQAIKTLEQTELNPSYNGIKSELEPCEDCISRAEAIEIFASWYGYDYDNQGYYRLLKQMPSVTPSYNGVKTELKPRTNLAETSQDTISREALRQKLQDHHDFFVNAYGNFRGMSLSDKTRVDEIDNCIAMVVNAPSVTPEPKVGKWTCTDDMDEWYGKLFRCSVCGAKVLEADRYCPYCGSKMEVEDENKTK